jgi:transmembrane sensor
MKNDELDQLVVKYYEGEASEAEEQLLERILLDNNYASSEYAAERDVMAFFASQKGSELPPEFDRQFMLAIDQHTLQSKNKTLRWVTGIAAVISMLAMVIYLLVTPKEMVNISTGSNEKKDIKLPDGSSVSLNRNTAIRYALNFTVREISLTGEAYFEVAPDNDHPFRIITSESVTEVTGTSFNLRSNDTESVVELAVVTGSVVFSTTDLKERIFLSGGNHGIFDKKRNVLKKYERTDPNSLAWKTGQLAFNDAPMEEVIEVLRRYFDRPIIAENADLLYCHFNGQFNHPQLSEVLDVFDFTMNIKSEIKNDTLKLYGKGCNP